MKLMIASDLHGSAHYCRLLLEAFRSSGADRLVLLGDLLYHGPRNPLPAAYCRQLIEAYRKEVPDRFLILGDLLYHGPRNDLPLEYAPKQVIEMLNGIKDELLCVRGNCEAEVDQMVLDFPVLADYAWLDVNGLRIFATHGHLHGQDNPPPLKANDILLCGHTHIPCFKKQETCVYVNPGSVSIPKENTPHSYMILEEKTFTWKTLDGDIYRMEAL